MSKHYPVPDCSNGVHRVDTASVPLRHKLPDLVSRLMQAVRAEQSVSDYIKVAFE